MHHQSLNHDSEWTCPREQFNFWIENVNKKIEEDLCLCSKIKQTFTVTQLKTRQEEMEEKKIAKIECS